MVLGHLEAVARPVEVEMGIPDVQAQAIGREGPARFPTSVAEVSGFPFGIRQLPSGEADLISGALVGNGEANEEVVPRSPVAKPT